MSHSSNEPRQLRSPWLQFRLSYLIYLLTLVAFCFAILRQVFDIRGGWQFNALMSLYVAVLTVYFAFRFPVLVRRMLQGRREVQSRRSELVRLAKQAQAKKAEDTNP